MKKTQVILLTTAAALLAGCASERHEAISFNQLPPAAQTTVRNEIGDQPIAKISEETKYGQTAYKVSVERKGVKPSMVVAADGSILKESRRLMTLHNVNEAAGAQAPMSPPQGAPSPGPNQAPAQPPEQK